MMRIRARCWTTTAGRALLHSLTRISSRFGIARIVPQQQLKEHSHIDNSCPLFRAAFSANVRSDTPQVAPPDFVRKRGNIGQAQPAKVIELGMKAPKENVMMDNESCRMFAVGRKYPITLVPDNFSLFSQLPLS
jgi:hypothetical protein